MKLAKLATAIGVKSILQLGYKSKAAFLEEKTGWLLKPLEKPHARLSANLGARLPKEAYEELGLFFRAFDPRHERVKEIFTKLGYIDCQHLAPRIRAEVLMFTGLMDTICPPSTQFAAYNRSPRKRTSWSIRISPMSCCRDNST